MGRQPRAAHRQTSAYSLPSAAFWNESDRSISLLQLPERRSRRERFSKRICSSQCRSCQGFEVGQRSFVVFEGLCVFELEIEKFCEVRENVNEWLTIRRIGAQGCTIDSIRLGDETIPIFLQQLFIACCL